MELNQEYISKGEKDHALNPEELRDLEILVEGLETKKGPAAMSKPALDVMATIVKIITHWGPAQRLPALDLLRLTTAACPIPTTYESQYEPSVRLLEVLERGNVFDKGQPNNAMLGVRAFVNMFDSSKAREYAEETFERVFPLAVQSVEGSGNKNLKVAVATLALK